MALQIKFEYSHIYETHLNPDAKLLPSAEIENKIAEINTFWLKNGENIGSAFREVTGLDFKRSSVICYLNSIKCFSNPLTLTIEDTLDTQDNLVHELIHVLLMDNEESFIDKWRAMFERYKDESQVTKTHIGVHAIHELVAAIICPHRLERIKSYSVLPAYIRAWEIVKKDGAENIASSIFGPMTKL